MKVYVILKDVYTSYGMGEGRKTYLGDVFLDKQKAYARAKEIEENNQGTYCDIYEKEVQE